MENITEELKLQETEKTFNQNEVNRIVQERLERDRKSSVADFEKREQELNQREFNIKVKEILAEKNMPKELADVLKFTDEDSLNEAITTIQKIINNKTKTAFKGFVPTGNNTSVGDKPLRDAFRL